VSRVLPCFLVALLLAPTLSAQQAPSWPGATWQTSTPAAERMAAAPLDSLHARASRGAYGLVDHLFVTRHGRVVMDHRYPHDYREISRGKTAGAGCGLDACASPAEVHQYNYLHPDFHPFPEGKPVHSLQSITKSILSGLLGIAIGRGEVPEVGSKLLPLLREHDTSMATARLGEATLEDLLTMRLGIEWHEADRPADSTNTTLAMELSSDWVKFTLTQPMDAAPGERFVYNSGASHLMSAILRAHTGMTADRFAERHLFRPLGIHEYHWKVTDGGLPDGEGGLYLDGADLARIGLLYLRDGVWKEQRIIPEGWVAASTARQVDRVNTAGWGYGYQWWRLDRGDTVIWAGLGFGGQFLLVFPQHDVVAVANSWNVFGGPQSGVLGPLIAAILESLES
jgi:hypothetical protein